MAAHEELKMKQGLSGEIKRQRPEEKENHAGIPFQLKTQLEASSRLSFDDVRIHYHSGKPAQTLQHKAVPLPVRKAEPAAGQPVQCLRITRCSSAGEGTNVLEKTYESIQDMLSEFEEDESGRLRTLQYQWDLLLPGAQNELRDAAPDRRKWNTETKTKQYQIKRSISVDGHATAAEHNAAGGHTDAVEHNAVAEQDFIVTIEPEEWYAFTQGEKRSDFYWMEFSFREPEPGNGQALQDEFQRLEEDPRLCLIARLNRNQISAAGNSIKSRNCSRGEVEWEEEEVSDREGIIKLYKNKKTNQLIKLVQRQYTITETSQYVEMPSIASGDQFSVLAAMLAEPRLCLQIMVNNPEDDKESLFNFLRTSLGMNQPVVASEPESAGRGAVLESARHPETNQTIEVIKNYGDKNGLVGNKRHGKSQKVSRTTNIVAEKYNRDLKKRFRDAGGLNNEDLDEKLVSWMERKWPGLPGMISDNHFVILWFRFSGRRGQAHPEHDTSYRAMRELIGDLLGLSPSPVILLAGDDYGGKAQKIADGFKAACETNYIFNMTEFWKEKAVQQPVAEDSEAQGTVSLSDWGGNNRIGQARLYDYIVRHAKSVRHFGSRSGNLELMSLIGHKVTYIEEKSSIGGERMEAYQKHDENIPETSPDRLNYERIIIDQPLTFKGKFVKGAMEDAVSAHLEGAKEGSVSSEMLQMLLPEGLYQIVDLLISVQNSSRQPPQQPAEEGAQQPAKEGVEELKIQLANLPGQPPQQPAEEGAQQPAREGVEELKIQLAKQLEVYRVCMLKIMQDRENKLSEMPDIHKKLGDLSGIVERIAGCTYEQSMEYTTKDYPKIPGIPEIQFIFRKYLEQLYMLAAVLRKKNLKSASTDQPEADEAAASPDQPEWRKTFVDIVRTRIERVTDA